MIPAVLIKPLIGLVVVIALYFALSIYRQSVYQEGYKAASTFYSQREIKASNLAKAEAAASALTAFKKELKLLTELQAIDERRNREQSDANIKIEKLRADIASGTRRLSIPTTRASCSVPDATADSGSGVAAGSGGEERTELDPATSLDLVAVTKDGDTSIIERNTLIDKYNACRAAKMRGENNDD